MLEFGESASPPNQRGFMFGFLRGNHLDQTYRSLYARACQCHFEHNGRLASMFHSYEAVFLFSLASDLSLIRQPTSDDPTCCRLRRRVTQTQQELQIGEFCASFAMLLVRIKLEDDWQDDRSIISKLALRTFRTATEKSRRYFQKLDSEFDATINSILQSNRSLEQSKNPVSLEQFQAPTRAGFAYFFGLFAKQWLDDDQHRVFSQIGSEIGGAIIAFDCATDWHMDRRRGRFNPLPKLSNVSEAYQECGRCLARASWLCLELPSRSDSSGERVANQIARRWMSHALGLGERQTTSPGACKTAGSIHKKAWYSAPNMPALRRGDCDVCCALEACSSCEFGSGVCDVILCCDPCVGCVNSSSKNSNDKDANKNNLQSSQHNLRDFIGSSGLTNGQLSPAGLVTIAGTNYPASSHNGLFIDSGVKVTVVSADNFGLKVANSS
jgi:Family of unknown function (DUF5685)